MNKKISKFIFLSVLGLSCASLQAATITVSIIRTTMPVDQWNALTASSETWESTVSSYSANYDFTFSVDASVDSLDFVYNFPNGWDYPFYSLWKDEVVSILNANTPPSAGYMWDIFVSGEIDPESNPWRNVYWIKGSKIFDGDYIVADGLGWFWAPNWNINGEFYAYFYNALQWFYIYGDGYFYSKDNGWLLNLPGTNWVYNFEKGIWTTLWN